MQTKFEKDNIYRLKALSKRIQAFKLRHVGAHPRPQKCYQYFYFFVTHILLRSEIVLINSKQGYFCN